MVEAGHTGLLNSVNDVKGVANNIVALMLDDSVRAEMGKAARKRSEEKFELSDCASQTSELLSSLTQPRNVSERNIGRY
jgi:glycosyltransferase involved in cell wall biosynthesis